MADILSPDILEKIRFVPISVVAQMKGKSVVAIHRDIKKNKLMFMRIGDEYRVAIWENEYADYLRKVNYSQSDKYQMTYDSCVKYARTHLDDIIHAENQLNLSTTNDENLRLAWEVVLGAANSPFDMRLFKHINSVLGKGLVSDAGEVQPVETTAVVTGIRTIMNGEAMTVTDKAIRFILLLIHNPLFSANNEATAYLAGNVILMNGGAGIFVIPAEKQEEFKTLFEKCTNSNDDRDLIKFIYDECLIGE